MRTFGGRKGRCLFAASVFGQVATNPCGEAGDENLVPRSPKSSAGEFSVLDRQKQGSKTRQLTRQRGPADIAAFLNAFTLKWTVAKNLHSYCGYHGILRQ